jgi:hypothetical protein
MQLKPFQYRVAVEKQRQRLVGWQLVFPTHDDETVMNGPPGGLCGHKLQVSPLRCAPVEMTHRGELASVEVDEAGEEEEGQEVEHPVLFAAAAGG